LLYAYNASKRIAEKHAAQPVSVVQERSASEPPASTGADSAPVSAAPARSTTPLCEAELVVAQRALDARRGGEPLDRLLRIQEIAWQEPVARRQRLEKVATRWYEYEGEAPEPEALSVAVISDCVKFSPAP
jgi:hypothetical protein